MDLAKVSEFIVTYRGIFTLIGTAAVGFIIAYLTIKSQRAISRKRATIDLLSKIETDSTIKNAERTFLNLRDNGFPNMENPNTKIDKAQRAKLLAFLNHYELIFCGIMEDALDELFYFKFRRGSVIHHWHDVKPLVLAWRKATGNQMVFHKFQLFAERWEENRFVCRRGRFPYYYIHYRNYVAHYQD